MFTCPPALLAGGISIPAPHLTWTQKTASASKEWNAIAWGNPALTATGIFVAGGGQPGGGGAVPVMFSLDSGDTYANASVPPVFSGSPRIPAQNLAYGNGVFVCTNGGGVDNCATSTDGDIWTSGINIPGNITSIFFTGVNFVALGAGLNHCYTSPTGAVWTSRSLPSLDQWTIGAGGSGVTIAISQTGITALSLNHGSSWFAGGTLPSPFVVGVYGRVAFGNGTFVAVPNAADNRCFYTADLGGSYHVSTAVAGSQTYCDVDFSPTQSKFVVVDIGGQHCLKGSDGINYSATGLLPVNGSAIWAIANDGAGNFAAIGSLTAGTSITARGTY